MNFEVVLKSNCVVLVMALGEASRVVSVVLNMVVNAATPIIIFMYAVSPILLVYIFIN